MRNRGSTVKTSTGIKEKFSSIQKLFYKYGTLKTFKKNSFLFMKGDEPDLAFLVDDGLLKVCQLTDTGQNITFFIRKPGDAFALAEIVLDQPHFCFAQCLKESHVWVLEASIIKKKMETNINILKDILYLMTSRLIDHQSTVELLNSQSVPERLAWFLKEIYVMDDEASAVDLDLTHEEISNIIGCSRQTVTKIFNDWRRKGWMTYDRNKIIIHNLQDI